MIKVAQSLSELSDSITYLNLNCGSHSYPTEFQTYEEGWESLSQSLTHLRRKLGEARYTQLIEMAAQSKAHYDEGYALSDRTIEVIPGFDHIKLGSRLMQDMGQIVRGKPPFAYPEELYRWPRSNGA
ncbi:hypothetical protein [Sphingomonas sp. DT-204]|uniref:hypothetical protein n=1 Tax=Sphingomonas sp. DT-204 TaxID=3396166 RepID=UPI003F1C3A0F